MSRIRTHNNRRRTRDLKAGGLYRVGPNGARILPGSWAASDADPLADLQQWIKEMSA